MFDNINVSEDKTIVEQRKEISPRLVNIEKVKVEKLWPEVNFKEKTHKAIYIKTYERGSIQAIIHNSISNAILPNYTYRLWWDRTDKCLDRWLEILDFEFVRRII